VIDLYLEYFDLFGISEYVMRSRPMHAKPGWARNMSTTRTPVAQDRRYGAPRHAQAQHPLVEVADEAAFYGPKIDVQVKSAIGREFTLATNQVDFAVPERFDLKFINEEGQEERPLIIHRAPLSTHERMIGFLLEHYAGAFPVWLSPEQVRVIPITDGQNEAAGSCATAARRACAPRPTWARSA
jgi:threonyl-tRNA synthetase